MSLEPRNELPGRRRRAPFLCECGNSLCPERVWLTRLEYDRLIGGVGLALAPGHEDWEPEPLGQCRCGRSRKPGNGRSGD